MGKITIAGRVPAAETNGLGPYSDKLMVEPLKLVPVVAMVAVMKITEKTETGEKYPTIAIHHVEIVPEKHRKAFAKMLGDALADRTGAQQLPFDLDASVPMKDPFPEPPEEAESGEGGDED